MRNFYKTFLFFAFIGGYSFENVLSMEVETKITKGKQKEVFESRFLTDFNRQKGKKAPELRHLTLELYEICDLNRILNYCACKIHTIYSVDYKGFLETKKEEVEGILANKKYEKEMTSKASNKRRAIAKLEEEIGKLGTFEEEGKKVTEWDIRYADRSLSDLIEVVKWEGDIEGQKEIKEKLEGFQIRLSEISTSIKQRKTEGYIEAFQQEIKKAFQDNKESSQIDIHPLSNKIQEIGEKYLELLYGIPSEYAKKKSEEVRKELTKYNIELLQIANEQEEKKRNEESKEKAPPVVEAAPPVVKTATLVVKREGGEQASSQIKNHTKLQQILGGFYRYPSTNRYPYTIVGAIGGALMGIIWVTKGRKLLLNKIQKSSSPKEKNSLPKNRSKKHENWKKHVCDLLQVTGCAAIGGLIGLLKDKAK